MKQSSALWLSVVGLSFVVCPLHAADQGLATASVPYAPLDIAQAKHPDANVPLSKTERRELLGEFKGLVYMGLQKVAYNRWPGKSMADCYPAESPKEAWQYKCEIITGQGNGFYYFYPNESRQSLTLQHVDIRIHAADQALMDDFRKPLQDMFGKAGVATQTMLAARPASPIRHWNTGNDVADLFVDQSVRPQGSVRFVWMRTPLVGGSQARLPDKINPTMR